jgi:hypothetical protein
MPSTQPALGSDRLRMLALMDIDVYVRRVRGAPPPMSRETISAEPPARAPVPAAIERGARVSAAAVATRIAEPLPARVLFATGNDGGFDGRYGALLRGIALALGIDPRAVACGAPRGGVPCICFGAAPGAALDVVLAPPLASVRGSAAARRALWTSLRPLARRLGT